MFLAFGVCWSSVSPFDVTNFCYIDYTPPSVGRNKEMHKRAKKMAPTKEVHFRLRRTTVDMLREELERSPHRSMAARADEIIEAAILRRRNERMRWEERNDD